jgi:hypothetical protein
VVEARKAGWRMGAKVRAEVKKKKEKESMCKQRD